MSVAALGLEGGRWFGGTAPVREEPVGRVLSPKQEKEIEAIYALMSLARLDAGAALGGGINWGRGEILDVMPNGAVIYKDSDAMGITWEKVLEHAEPTSRLIEPAEIILDGLTAAAVLPLVLVDGPKWLLAKLSSNPEIRNLTFDDVQGRSIMEISPAVYKAFTWAMILAVVTGSAAGGVVPPRSTDKSGGDSGGSGGEHPYGKWGLLASIAGSLILLLERCGVEMPRPGVTVEPGPTRTPIPTILPPAAELTAVNSATMTATAVNSPEATAVLPATQEAMFITNLPAIMSAMGGAGDELRFWTNPAFADRLTAEYIVLTGRLDGGGVQETMTNLAGISLCQNDKCFSFSAVFPEKMLGSDGLEYRYRPAGSRDGLIMYTAKIPGSVEGEESVLAFVNRFLDRSGEGLFPVTAVDRENGELLLLWLDNNGDVVEMVNHVRTIEPGEAASVDYNTGRVKIGTETIDIGAPPLPIATAVPTEKPTAAPTAKPTEALPLPTAVAAPPEALPTPESCWVPSPGGPGDTESCFSRTGERLTHLEGDNIRLAELSLPSTCGGENFWSDENGRAIDKLNVRLQELRNLGLPADPTFLEYTRDRGDQMPGIVYMWIPGDGPCRFPAPPPVP